MKHKCRVTNYLYFESLGYLFVYLIQDYDYIYEIIIINREKNSINDTMAHHGQKVQNKIFSSGLPVCWSTELIFHRFSASHQNAYKAECVRLPLNPRCPF